MGSPARAGGCTRSRPALLKGGAPELWVKEGGPFLSGRRSISAAPLSHSRLLGRNLSDSSSPRPALRGSGGRTGTEGPLLDSGRCCRELPAASSRSAEQGRGRRRQKTTSQRSFPRRGPRPPSPPANSRLRLETLSEAFAATIITPHQAELGPASRPGRGASGRGRHRSSPPAHTHTHTAAAGSAFAPGESWELLSAEPARKSSRVPGAACGADAQLAMSGRPGREGEAGHPAWTRPRRSRVAVLWLRSQDPLYQVPEFARSPGTQTS